MLYIDDLDRCRADRVIEVLEAVHLLLAFPLFAVVVAVDPRWLRQSLLDHYPRLLGGADDAGATLRARTLGRPATPQDYLEKIFQVPFNLQAMEKTGFEALVKHLFPIVEMATKTAQPALAAPIAPRLEDPVIHPPTPVVKHVFPIVETATKAAPLAPVVPIAPPLEDPVTNPPTPAPEPKMVDSQPAPSVPSPASEPTSSGKQSKQPPPDPQRLALTKKEVADIQRFQPLFQTPRAVKRLANTYSLIRVGVNEADWSDYLGPDETPGIYRVPMLLLAVTSAFPALARPWLLWLRETPPTRWQLTNEDIASLTTKHADTTDSADWSRLARSLDQLKLEDRPVPELKPLEKWVPRVARYSF